MVFMRIKFFRFRKIEGNSENSFTDFVKEEMQYERNAVPGKFVT